MYRMDPFPTIGKVTVTALRQCGVPVPVAGTQVPLVPAGAAPTAEAGRDA